MQELSTSRTSRHGICGSQPTSLMPNDRPPTRPPAFSFALENDVLTFKRLAKQSNRVSLRSWREIRRRRWRCLRVLSVAVAPGIVQHSSHDARTRGRAGEFRGKPAAPQNLVTCWPAARVDARFAVRGGSALVGPRSAKLLYTSNPMYDRLTSLPTRSHPHQLSLAVPSCIA